MTKVSRKSTQLNWLPARHDFDGGTWLHAHGWFDGLSCEVECDDEDDAAGKRSLYLIDCNAWPPAETDMSQVRPGIDGGELVLVGVEEGRQYWRRLLEQSSHGDRDLFQYEVRCGDVFTPFGPPLRGDFHSLDCVVADGILYGLHRPDGQDRRCVDRVGADAAETIFAPEGRVVLAGLRPGRVLIAVHHPHMTSLKQARYWLWDERRATPLSGPYRFPAIPVQVDSALAWLEGDDILFCSVTEQPHANNMAGHERTLHLHRLDVVTGAHRHAPLPLFGSTMRFDARMLTTQPKQMVTLQSFEGHIAIVRGGGDWWILNYRTQRIGKHTICWLWNRASDTVVQIASGDMPGQDVLAVLYSRGLDGYLVSVPHAVHRLAALDDIVAARGSTALHWE